MFKFLIYSEHLPPMRCFLCNLFLPLVSCLTFWWFFSLLQRYTKFWWNPFVCLCFCFLCFRESCVNSPVNPSVLKCPGCYYMDFVSWSFGEFVYSNSFFGWGEGLSLGWGSFLGVGVFGVFYTEDHIMEPGVLAHIFNPSILEAEAGSSL